VVRSPLLVPDSGVNRTMGTILDFGA
jgi:hypothetical protein